MKDFTGEVRVTPPPLQSFLGPDCICQVLNTAREASKTVKQNRKLKVDGSFFFKSKEFSILLVPPKNKKKTVFFLF